MVTVTILYYVALAVFTLVYFFIYTAVFVLTLPFDRNRAVLHRVGGMWSWAIFRMNPVWRVRVTGRENIRKGTPYVVVANHRSMIDIPLLYSLRFNFKWVSKVEVLKWPLFGVVLWMQNNILIRRGESGEARKFLDKGREILRRGVSVAVFPEGTRSRDGEMRRFREGAFLLAAKTGAEILPVVMDGTGNVSDGWKLKKGHRFSVSILPPVSMEGKDPKTAAVELREVMMAEYDRIKNG